MSEFDELALAQAKTWLSGMAGVRVLSEWRPFPNSAVWMLKLRLDLVGAEPTATVPQFTEWELVVDFGQDLWGKVQVHPATGEHGLSDTFRHQQFNGGPHAKWPCRNGFICTPSWLSKLAKNRGAVQDEPSATAQRLCWHVKRALEWLPIAATGLLTQAGDPFELPDFVSMPGARNHALAYYENADSFQHWQQQSATSGIVHLSTATRLFVPHRFMDAKDRQVVYQPAWGKHLSGVKPTEQIPALWVRLNEVPVVNGWQVPATMDQLKEALAKQSIDLLQLLEPALKYVQLGKGATAVLLVGMPIAKRVGEAPYRYHWQALELIPPAALQFPKMNRDTLRTYLSKPHALHWIAKAENWHPDELQNRGRLSAPLRESRVLVLGAGALGSVVAEQLVRMGVEQLTIADGDAMEAGNLVRHPLGMGQLFDNKAVAVAKRLTLANPSAWVEGIPHSVPTDSAEFAQAVRTATLIIDATANDDVLRMIPLPEMNLEALFVSCSLSLGAEQLFFYAARVSEFQQSDFDAWYEPFRMKQNELAQELELPRGAGCWHPLTPAPLNRIAGLAGAVVELLEKTCETSISLPVSVSYNWPVPSLVAPEPEHAP